MSAKKEVGNAAFMCEAPAFHQGPRPLTARRQARSSSRPSLRVQVLEGVGERAATAAPLFRTTRWYASRMLARSTTRSISA
jgi:hypothetical protein